MAALAEEQTKWLVDARSAAQAEFDIVGSNGIYDARSLQRRLNLGASMVSCTTLFWESSRGWGDAVDQVLQQFSESDAQLDVR
jgi:dihydroorotate dehydrogenase